MTPQARNSREGFSLGVSLVYIALIALVIGSLLSLMLTEYRMTRDTTSRVQALYIAEAGIDLALHEFTLEAQGRKAWSGWTSDGAIHKTYSIEGLISNAQLHVTADTDSLRVTASASTPSAPGCRPGAFAIDAILKKTGSGYVVAKWTE